jgi:UDPglucose 6-dehydrogenase
MAKKFVIGIMGVGMVGGAMKNYFESAGNEVVAYDPFKNFSDASVLEKADYIFVCVPTPYLVDGGGFDLSFVKNAMDLIPDNKVAVIKSTVLPGTTEQLQKEYPKLKILFNPEFLTESTADQDMRYPDRQIVGYTKESFTSAADLMMMLPAAPFERIMPATEAEMVKYYGNTWFAVKVVFANQMYDVCDKLGLDYDVVRDAAAADKRIGRSHLDVFHKGSRGYGGKCLPKDTRALIQLGDRLGLSLDLLKTTDAINTKLVGEKGKG